MFGHIFLGGKGLRLSLTFCLLAGMVLANSEREAQAEKVRIVLVGDSTVTDQAGWGLAFAALLKPTAECVNQAKGGASSKSYYEGAYWKRALAQKPAYVLIQFGHNDQPGKGPERETDPQTTYRTYLGKYIDEAREKGAKPILVTSLIRRIFTAEGKIDSSLAPYAAAMREVAAEKKVPLVDLHRLSLELAERVGPKASESFGPPHPKLAGRFDGTHLSPKGAAMIAPLVVQGLWEAEPALRSHLSIPQP